jgi:glycosyltransferase involved in cell wall biosynthesis
LYEGTFFLNGITARGAKPDLVVGVVPSLSGAAIARILAARWHVPYAVIVQDLMGPAASESGIRGGHRISGLVARAEAWSLRRARLVAPVSEAFLPYLHSIGIPDQRIAHLPNWTLHSRNDGDRAETRRRLGWGDEQIVLHAGNMGLKQHLEQVLAVAQLAIHDAPDVRFVLLGDGNQRSALQRQAVMLPNVEFLPTQGDDDYDLALNAADVLLVSERATVADMSLPSKLTAYCAAGRPIVAAVRQNGATYHEVISSGAGLVVPAGHPEELLEALGRLREDPALCDRLSAAGRRYAAEALMGSAALARAEALVDGLLRSARAGESTS